ncbi:MAG: GIY-YIG nuclease family protein [Ignavibacteriaceae bacterium]
MFIVYILQSTKTKRFYTGHTNHLKRRFSEHNNGHSSSTKGGIPWIIIWMQECSSRNEATRLENKIKARGAKRFLQDLEKD